MNYHNRPFYFVLQRWLKSYDLLRHEKPKYTYLAKMIIDDIDAGHFKNGDKLPPHRDVADELNISIQTVSSAYRDIEYQGYIHCEVGRGSYVSKRSTDDTGNFIRDIRDDNIIDLSVIRPIYNRQHDIINNETYLSLANSDQFHWMRACRPVSGFFKHREILSQWIQHKAPHAKIENTIVVNGCSQGIFLTLASLIHPDDVVLTEKLTDHGIIGCSRILRFILKGVDFDKHGIIPECFEKACQLEKIKALVITPNFTNPTFALMSENRRIKIAEIAQKYGVIIIEDDVHGELIPYNLPSISEFIPEQSFYVTSFSKSTMTGARVGIVVCPPNYTQKVESSLKVTSWMATPLMAEMVCRWIEFGQYEKLISIQKKLILQRHNILISSLQDYMPYHQSPCLGAWLVLPDHIQSDSLFKQLALENIAVTLADPFLVDTKSKTNAIRICSGGDLSLKNFTLAVSKIKDNIQAHHL